MTDCTWEQAVSQLGGGIGVYSTFMAKGLNELSLFIREAKESAGSRRLLRTLEVKLGQLDKTFSACERLAQEAVMADRILEDKELRAIRGQWPEVRSPYYYVGTLVQRIIVQSGSGGITELPGLFEKLTETYKTLDYDVGNGSMALIPKDTPRFRTALQILTSRVSAELDRTIDEGLA
ncbi:MAG: hypothetical protein NT169_02840 [Chloroflexi bacterium]|nr:hypothetical protein [Chloroflexota bacterium]